MPTNHVCMDYEPFKVSYTAGQAYVGATPVDVSASAARQPCGNFIAWDARPGKIVWSIQGSSRRGRGASPRPAAWCSHGTLEAI